MELLGARRVQINPPGYQPELSREADPLDVYTHTHTHTHTRTHTRTHTQIYFKELAHVIVGQAGSGNPRRGLRVTVWRQNSFFSGPQFLLPRPPTDGMRPTTSRKVHLLD